MAKKTHFYFCSVELEELLQLHWLVENIFLLTRDYKKKYSLAIKLREILFLDNYKKFYLRGVYKEKYFKINRRKVGYGEIKKIHLLCFL